MNVEIVNLLKKYKNNTVLDYVDMTINKPGVYLIAGPNGSGKTTLLETLVGLRKKDQGNVKVNNKEVDNGVTMKRYVGFLPQQNTLRKNCTVSEELNLVKQLFQLKIDTYQYLKKYNLQEFYYHNIMDPRF